MKIAGAFVLSLLAYIMPVGVSMVHNYDATFHKGGYFNYSLEQGADLPIILRSTYDLDRYINDLIKSYKNNAIYPVGYLDMLEQEVRAFYSRYDRVFFADNNLIIALIDRGSGSLSFKLTDLAVQGDTLIINIKRHVPMIQTMDYRLWVMTLGINKNCFDGNKVDIRIS